MMLKQVFVLAAVGLSMVSAAATSTTPVMSGLYAAASDATVAQSAKSDQLLPPPKSSISSRAAEAAPMTCDVGHDQMCGPCMFCDKNGNGNGKKGKCAARPDGPYDSCNDDHTCVAGKCQAVGVEEPPAEKCKARECSKLSNSDYDCSCIDNGYGGQMCACNPACEHGGQWPNCNPDPNACPDTCYDYYGCSYCNGNECVKKPDHTPCERNSACMNGQCKCTNGLVGYPGYCQIANCNVNNCDSASDHTRICSCGAESGICECYSTIHSGEQIMTV